MPKPVLACAVDRYLAEFQPTSLYQLKDTLYVADALFRKPFLTQNDKTLTKTQEPGNHIYRFIGDT